MRMLNQAIEDAAAFTALRDALTQHNPDVITERRYRLVEIPKLPSESRQQYRSRMRAESKAAKKAQVKA